MADKADSHTRQGQIPQPPHMQICPEECWMHRLKISLA